MHLAMRPTPCTTGQVHLLVYYKAKSRKSVVSTAQGHSQAYLKGVLNSAAGSLPSMQMQIHVPIDPTYLA